MRVRFPRLFFALTKYYVGVALVLLIAFALHPHIREFLPIGGVEELISQQVAGPFDGVEIGASDTGTLGSFIWLMIAVVAALLAALPVSWTYMSVRSDDDYDQSIVQTIILLPMIVTGIVIVVHDSIALAFSLAGIAAGVQFRNSLKSPGDAMFILLSVGNGLSAGIGAVELAFVVTIGFNYAFLVLWMYDYGARDAHGTERYLRPLFPKRRNPDEEPVGAGEKKKKKKKKKKEKREEAERAELERDDQRNPLGAAPVDPPADEAPPPDQPETRS